MDLDNMAKIASEEMDKDLRDQLEKEPNWLPGLIQIQFLRMLCQLNKNIEELSQKLLKEPVKGGVPGA